VLLDFGDDGLDSLQVLSIACQGPMRQGKTIAGHHQRRNDLLAVAAMVSPGLWLLRSSGLTAIASTLRRHAAKPEEAVNPGMSDAPT
jgi:hypothetical protein